MPGPSPALPAPGQPAPGQPAPGQPAPGQPAPRSPTPGQPAPRSPAPGQPAPGQPAPRSPGHTGPTAKPGGSFFFEAGRRGQVVVITDSSASAGVGGEDSVGVSIVPLRVLAGPAAADDDGPSGQLSPAIAAEVGRGERLTTARPAPEHFAAVYRLAASAGVPAIVSVHLAAELSGTIGSARLAAAGAAVPVQVVDSRTIGAGLGFVVAAASRAARSGQSAAEVARAAAGRAARTVSFFALDTEEHLRAGGRLSAGPGGPGQLGGAGPAGAIAGPAPGLARSAGRGLLASRPLLRIADGTITILERVRTRAAARDRLIDLAADAAAALPGDCQLAVQFLGSRDEATQLQSQLTATIPATGRCPVVRASTAILAHTGPGLLSVIITPAL